MIKYRDLDFCSMQTILLILQSIFIVCLLYYAISLYTNIVEREDDDNRFIKCSMTHILAFREHTDMHNSACQYSLFLKAFLINTTPFACSLNSLIACIVGILQKV